MSATAGYPEHNIGFDVFAALDFEVSSEAAEDMAKLDAIRTPEFEKLMWNMSGYLGKVANAGVAHYYEVPAGRSKAATSIRSLIAPFTSFPRVQTYDRTESLVRVIVNEIDELEEDSPMIYYEDYLVDIVSGNIGRHSQEVLPACNGISYSLRYGASQLPKLRVDKRIEGDLEAYVDLTIHLGSSYEERLLKSVTPYDRLESARDLSIVADELSKGARVPVADLKYQLY